MNIKTKMARMKIRDTIALLVSSLAYDSATIWTIASPSSAPQASEKRNFRVASKVFSEMHFFTRTNTIAAMKPRREIPNPAKKPKPQI